MAVAKEVKTAGRPKKEIDWNQFEDLCALQCTQSEIASFLKIHHETLIIRAREKYEEDYPSIYKKYSEGGKCSLRRNQFAMSRKNASMAIWLGKQWLEQREPETKVKDDLPPREMILQLEDQNIRLQYEIDKLKKLIHDPKP
jgi:hypothetical protein